MANRSTPTLQQLAPIVVGIALQPLALTLHGFPRGLLQGAGIALILIGVYIVSARFRGGRKGSEHKGGMWLPSRDQDDQ